MRSKSYYLFRTFIRWVFWTTAFYLLMQSAYSFGQVLIQWYK